MKQYSPLDLAQNQLQNAVAHPLAGAPSAPKFGQFYFNTTSNILFVWNGTSWRPADAAGLTDGSIALSALATNPLARANHTGTQTASTISDLATTVKGYRLDEFAAPTASVAFGNQKLTGVAAGVADTDGVNFGQLKGAIQDAAAGIDSKPSVRVVAVANQALSGLRTIDGISMAGGDRILLTAQTTASQNGVYVVASGAWTRAIDADGAGEITAGAFWFVEEGATYGKTQWRCNNTGAVTIGTTAIAVVQFGAANLYDAGDGLQLNGTIFSIKLQATGSLLTVGTSGLAVDTTKVATKFVGLLTHNGTDTQFTVTHSLGTKSINPAFRDSNDEGVNVDWRASTINQMIVTFGAPLPNGTVINYVVMG